MWGCCPLLTKFWIYLVYEHVSCALYDIDMVRY
jgi:hypothetical protein